MSILKATDHRVWKLNHYPYLINLHCFPHKHLLRGAIQMAGEGLGKGGQVSHPLADSQLACTLVQHLRGSLQGSGVHEGGDGGAPLLLPR
jgi:hypothetical protein